MSNPCPDDSLWLRLIDQDTNRTLEEDLDRHLSECLACQQTFEEIATIADWTDTALTHLNLPSRRPRWPRITAKHLSWGAVVAALLIMLTPTSRRALAELFTVIKPRHLAAVSLGPGQLSQMTNKIMQKGKVNLAHYASITTVQAPKSFSARSPGRLLQKAGLPNHWPKTFSQASYVGLTGQTAGHFVVRLNVSNINQLIRMQGGTHLFPQNLSNVPMTIKIPAWTAVTFQKGASQYNLTEMGIPSLQVPGHAHLAQIAAAMESLPFLPQQVQSALGALRSRLANTVIVPFRGGQTRHIRFDGHSAELNTQAGSVTIVWLGRHALYDFTYYGPKSSASVLKEVSGWFR